MSRLHTRISRATLCTVNTVQSNKSPGSFHSYNENIPLTIPSSILPKSPTFRVFLLPYSSPRPGAVLERYSVIDIIIHWTFESFKVFVLVRMKTREPTRNFNVIVFRDSLWFQVTVFPECCSASMCEWWAKFSLNMWPSRVLETSDINHPVTRSHIHEVKRPQLYQCDKT